MRISLPRWSISRVSLIAPGGPAISRAARKQLEKRPRAASFKNVVLLIWLARMLALARCQQVHLPPPRREGAGVLAAHTEQDQLSDIAEIETDSAPVRAAVFPYLVPDDVGFVCEAPRLQDSEPLGQHGVRAPEIQMRSGRSKLTDRKRHDLVELHRAVTRQALVLWPDLAGLVGELPGRVSEDRAKMSTSCKAQQVPGRITAKPSNSRDVFFGKRERIERLRPARSLPLARFAPGRCTATVAPLSLRHNRRRR